MCLQMEISLYMDEFIGRQICFQLSLKQIKASANSSNEWNHLNELCYGRDLKLRQNKQYEHVSLGLGKSRFMDNSSIE